MITHFKLSKILTKSHTGKQKLVFVSRVNKMTPLSSSKTNSSKKHAVTSASEGGIILGDEVPQAEEYNLLPGNITPASEGGAKTHAKKRTSSTSVSEENKVSQLKSILTKHKQTRSYRLTEGGGQAAANQITDKPLKVSHKNIGAILIVLNRHKRLHDQVNRATVFTD